MFAGDNTSSSTPAFPIVVVMVSAKKSEEVTALPNTPYWLNATRTHRPSTVMSHIGKVATS